MAGPFDHAARAQTTNLRSHVAWSSGLTDAIEGSAKLCSISNVNSAGMALQILYEASLKYFILPRCLGRRPPPSSPKAHSAQVLHAASSAAPLSPKALNPETPRP